MPKFKLNYASNYVTIKGTAEADSVDTVRKALPSAVIKEQAPRKPRQAKKPVGAAGAKTAIV